MIQLENLTRRFGDAVAVNAVNLTVETGEVCVLVGSSGCGKSTTLQMINRLLPISSGRILVNGKDINTLNARELRLSMGYVIQGTGLFPHWTVARNIATVPHLLKWAPQRIQQRIDELLQLLNLEPAQYRNQYPSQLSGGQAQRVGVARALAADPGILLMDEPFGALDAITRDTLQLEVLRIQRQVKKTIVFVTHDIDEALKLASRIAVMDQGRLIQYDTPDNILRRPANEFVENLVGQQDRGLKMLALKQVGQVMTPTIAPGPGVVPEATIYDDDSLRAALSVMLWHNLEQSPVYDRQGLQTGLVTRAQVCGDLA